MSEIKLPVLYTPVQNPLVQTLLEKNHLSHNVFFNGEKKYHNHFPHVLLSLLDLGADDKRLEKEYNNESYLERIPERKKPAISEENWKDHLADESFYSNYLDFFDEQVSEHGEAQTIQKFAFDLAVLPSLVSGVFHPLIHLAFGVDFGEPIVVAESLALMCVEKPLVAPLLDFDDFLLEEKRQSKSILQILREMEKDKSLDSAVDFKTENKQFACVSNAAHRLKRYAMEWVVERDPISITKKLKELYEAAALMYAATCFHPGESSSPSKESNVKLDFFMLHVLTSTLSVRTLLPHLSMTDAVLLLKSHLSVTLMTYLSVGRPTIQKEKLFSYEPSQHLESWYGLKKLAIESENLHVPKIIRALQVANDMYDEKALVESETLWFKAALLTIDRIVLLRNEHIKGEKVWYFNGCGFKETWELPEVQSL